MTGAVLPLVVKDFHLSGSKSGLLGSLFMVVYSVVSLVAGWLADHWPRLRLAAIGVLVWSAATVTSGLAPVFLVLLIARAMSGVGEATYSVVTPSLLSDSYAPDKRGGALFTFTLGGMAFWVPTFLLEERGIPLATANTRFGILLVVTGIVGSVTGGQVGDALARRFRSAHFVFSGAVTIIAVPLIVVAIRSH